MSSKFSLLLLGLIASAGWSTQITAAPHGGKALAKPSMMTSDLPRVADAKPQKAAETREKTAASAEKAAREKKARAIAKAKARARAKQKAAAAAKAKATAKRQAAAKAKAKPSPRRARYVSERERALDVAAHYAPNAIARLRRKRTIERAETSRASQNAGWRRYVD